MPHPKAEQKYLYALVERAAASFQSKSGNLKTAQYPAALPHLTTNGIVNVQWNLSVEFQLLAFLTQRFCRLNFGRIDEPPCLIRYSRHERYSSLHVWWRLNMSSSRITQSK
jgi:hypothetical protein